MSYAHHGQLKNMSTCQKPCHKHAKLRFMPMFVQVKKPTNLKRQIEGKPKESMFSHCFPIGRGKMEKVTKFAV